MDEKYFSLALSISSLSHSRYACDQSTFADFCPRFTTSCKNLKQLKPIQDRRELRNVEQGSVPEPFEPQIFVKDQTFVNGVGMRMIRVLAGSFQMGDATGKGYDDELPAADGNPGRLPPRGD